MSTAELKSDIHLLLENTTDKDILNIIFGILSKSKKGGKEAISLNAFEKKAVDEALKSIKAGKVYSHEKIMADMKKRYPSLIK